MAAQERCLLCDGRLDAPAKPLPVGRILAGGDLLVCRRCGSAQVTPRSARRALDDLYDASYYDGSAGAGALAGGADDANPKLRRRLHALERRYGTGARLLDLGCATGVFVAYALRRGWRAIGVEPSAPAAELGRKTRGVEIITGTIETATLEPASFDVVHANHVLEHVDDPVATLRAVRRVLKPGGVFVAEVPFELSVPFAERIAARLGRPGERPQSSYHLSFFSKRGLAAVSERAGLKVEEIRGEYRELPDQAGASSLKRAGLRVLYALERVSAEPAALLVIARASREGEGRAP